MREIKEPEKIREKLEKSELFRKIRQVFPVDVSISTIDRLNIRIHLVDLDVDLVDHVDIEVDLNHRVCVGEALFAIASVWKMRHFYKN